MFGVPEYDQYRPNLDAPSRILTEEQKDRLNTLYEDYSDQIHGFAERYCFDSDEEIDFIGGDSRSCTYEVGYMAYNRISTVKSVIEEIVNDNTQHDLALGYLGERAMNNGH